MSCISYLSWNKMRVHILSNGNVKVVSHFRILVVHRETIGSWGWPRCPHAVKRRIVWFILGLFNCFRSRNYKICGPCMEYASNMEYCYFWGKKCDDTVMKRHVNAWIKWRWSSLVPADFNFVLCWWCSTACFIARNKICTSNGVQTVSGTENDMLLCEFCK
jgi:hypothetical protein